MVTSKTKKYQFLPSLLLWCCWWPASLPLVSN